MRKIILVSCLALSACQFIPGTDAAKIREAERAMRDKLNDGDSGKFRNERVIYTAVVCGEVNGRNGFGAYAGFMPFSYNSTTKAIGGITEDVLRNKLVRDDNFEIGCIPEELKTGDRLVDEAYLAYHPVR